MESISRSFLTMSLSGMLRQILCHFYKKIMAVRIKSMVVGEFFISE